MPRFLAAAIFGLFVSAFVFELVQSGMESYGMRICGNVEERSFSVCYAFVKHESVGEALPYAIVVWIVVSIAMSIAIDKYNSSG